MKPRSERRSPSGSSVGACRWTCTARGHPRSVKRGSSGSPGQSRPEGRSRHRTTSTAGGTAAPADTTAPADTAPASARACGRRANGRRLRRAVPETERDDVRVPRSVYERLDGAASPSPSTSACYDAAAADAALADLDLYGYNTVRLRGRCLAGRRLRADPLGRLPGQCPRLPGQGSARGIQVIVVAEGPPGRATPCRSPAAPPPARRRTPTDGGRGEQRSLLAAIAGRRPSRPSARRSCPTSAAEAPSALTRLSSRSPRER